MPGAPQKQVINAIVEHAKKSVQTNKKVKKKPKQVMISN